MLTLEGCQTRRQRLWDQIPDHIEWVLIADPRHVNYFSAFLVNPISFSTGERGLLLLEREGKATLLGDNFALKSAATDPFVDEEVAFPWYNHKHSVINRDHALFGAVKQISEKLYGRPGAAEAEWLPLGASEILALDHESHSTAHEKADTPQTKQPIDLGTTIRRLRRQKEADEIALMKLCMKAGEAGHVRAKELVAPGVSELELYREVQSAAVGAAGRPAIVYGDFRACTLASPKQGGPPTDYKLREGDIFVLDYSVMINGYRSDFTNAIAVGTPSEGQKELFSICQAGMAGGESTLKAGAACKDVYAAVAGPFADAGKTDAFPHHAGHGLGMGHPEAPILVPESEETLLAGDVVTLEPGAYVEGVGGMRIEHNYLITDDGYERLSNHEIALS